MSISKAILLTLLIAAIEALIQILFFVGFDSENEPNTIVHVHGWAIIISRLTAYYTVFYYFFRPKWKQEFSSKGTASFPTLVFLLILIVGHELVSRPFFDFKEILASYSETEIQHNNYTFGGFSLYFIYKSIAAIILAPVLEEVFFRKHLLGDLLKNYNQIVAIGISSLLFSLIHWEDPTNLIPAFIFGVISAIVYIKTGKISWCILLHAFGNLLSILLEITGEHYYRWLEWLQFGALYWTLAGLGVLLLTFSLKWLPITNNKFQKSVTPIK